MTRMTEGTRDRIAAKIGAEIERLTNLLDGLNNSNSLAETVALKEFGIMGEVIPSRLTFHVRESMVKGRYHATLGEYDLDDPEGEGQSPIEAIQDLIDMNIDDLERRVMPSGWKPRNGRSEEIIANLERLIHALKNNHVIAVGDK